jgi:glycosyltransferase involved in cell wall biosynthesis
VRILHFIYDHPRNPWIGGGGARRVERLRRGLVEAGHEVTLFSGAFPGCRKVERKDDGWRFLGSAKSYFWSNFSYAIAARRLARKLAPKHDLVIEDFAPWNPVGVHRFATPSIVQLQNYFGPQATGKYPLVGGVFRAIERSYPRKFRHAVVVNESLNVALGVQGEVIPMGAEDAWLKRPVADGDYVAFLGRIDFTQKGVDLLIAAARAVDAPFKIAGAGPEEARLREAISGLKNVEFVGRVEGKAKRAFLENARIVVLPSRFEGQPIVTLEAAALGKPLIVSDIAELAFAERAGFAETFPLAEPDAFARKISELHDASERRKELSGAARKFVEGRTWSEIATRFEAYCRSVVNSEKAL